MQLRLYFQGIHNKIRLPASYQYIIQGTIYHWLSYDKAMGTYLHDRGRSYEERHYKHFTFSALQGRYQIDNREIIFQDQMELQIRSIDADIVKVIYRALQCQDTFTLAGQECRITNVEVTDDIIDNPRLVIRMLSPVTVYRTDPDTGKTFYYSPHDEAFYTQVNQNFYRKYKAFYEEFPQESIVLKPQKISPRDKVVTRYKGIYITGWKGIYEISGLPEHLNFLYDVGLGAKNAQGFGMFEIFYK